MFIERFCLVKIKWFCKKMEKNKLAREEELHMSFYQVNNQNLRSGRDELRSLNEKLRMEKDNLNTCEVNLRNMWEGQANEQFHSSFVKSVSFLDAFYQLIVRYCEVIEIIADRYDTAEQKNIACINQSIF